MRYDIRYERVRAMITAPEIPRTQQGGIALCHRCQRKVYFAGGYMRMLVAAVQWQAIYCITRSR